MATTLITGFETATINEATTVSGSPTISTTTFRSGSRSLRVTNSGFGLEYNIRPTGGTLVNFVQSFRIYVNIAALPSGSSQIAAANGSAGGTSTAGTILKLNSSGTLTITDGGGSGSASSSLAFTVDGLWHRIDVDVSGTNRTVYVDGVQWVQSTTGGAVSAQPAFYFGGLVGGSTIDIFFDDAATDDSSIGAPVSGANNITALLIPTAGTNAGGWTDGAGGTGDIHGSVDNLPPVGVLASTAAAKIKNATSTITGDYVATMQTYIAAGIPVGSVINSVQSLVSHGEEITTGNPKPGANWIASNPAQTAGTGTFDYGNNVIEGTFPTGWPMHFGPVSVSPAVTLANAPTVTIRKNLASTRVTGCCFMGMYVDYTPPPIAKNPVTVLQAVRRASFF